MTNRNFGGKTDKEWARIGRAIVKKGKTKKTTKKAKKKCTCRGK